jgi:hypothetical protein
MNRISLTDLAKNESLEPLPEKECKSAEAEVLARFPNPLANPEEQSRVAFRVVRIAGARV